MVSDDEAKLPVSTADVVQEAVVRSEALSQCVSHLFFVFSIVYYRLTL